MNETWPISNFYLHIAFPSALASESPANTNDPVWVVLYAALLSPFRGGSPCLDAKRWYASSLFSPPPPAPASAPASAPTSPSHPLCAYTSFLADQCCCSVSIFPINSNWKSDFSFGFWIKNELNWAGFQALCIYHPPQHFCPGWHFRVWKVLTTKWPLSRTTSWRVKTFSNLQ